MSTRSQRIFRTLVLVLALCSAELPAAEHPSGRPGRVRVLVTDLADEPVPGARVTLDAASLVATTNELGTVWLSAVPVGPQVVVVSVLGGIDHETLVEVEPNSSVEATVRLEMMPFRDSVTVRGGILARGQARARNRQRQSAGIVEIVESDQIGRFPDLNAAEAALRLPGVTSLRDQGEARFVVVRGLPPELGSTTVNGERIPSGEADERIVSLDLFPTEALDAIEVHKTLQPSMDGDSIGGTVNLVTRVPPRGSRFGASFGSGPDDASDGDRTQASAVIGHRAGTDGPGFLLSASHLDVDRGVDALERLTGNDGPELLRFQDSVVERRRRSVTGAVDVPAGETGLVTLRGLWSDLEDRELRHRRDHRLEDEVLAQELKDRTETQEVRSMLATGSFLSGNSLLVDVRAGWNRADEDEPDRLDAVFVQEDVTFVEDAPHLVEGEDPDEMVLEEVRRELDGAHVEGWHAAIDLSRPLPATAGVGTVQVGVKIRSEDIARDDNLIVFESDDEIFLSGVVDADWKPADPFHVGGLPRGFDLGLFPDPVAAAGLIAVHHLEGTADPEEDLGDYTAQEEIRAAYAQVDVPLTSKLSILGGLRWEETESTYDAWSIDVDEEGELAELLPVSGGNASNELLPMAQLRWAPTEADVVRFAVTRSLARPGLENQAPYRLTLEEDEEVQLGNPGLRPTTAWNGDLLWERYLGATGRVAAGLFVKELDDVIALTRIDVPGEATILQPKNAGSATLRGLELAFESRFTRLPTPFDGLGLQVNATWTDASTDFPTRPGTGLPGQAQWVGNAALSYELGGFSGRLAWTGRDTLVEELGDTAEEDIVLDARSQLDLALRWQITRRFSLFAEALNLTDEPLRRFVGPDHRPFSEERYGWWAMAGIRFDL